MNAVIGAAAPALAAAVCFAVANTLQHHGVTRAADDGASGIRVLARVLTRPVWLLGIAADLVGMGLHALALSAGALAVVQPLLISALLFALPVSRLVTGRRIRAAEYGWAALVVTGLSVFLLATRPVAGHATADGAALTAGIGAVAALAAVAVAMAGRRGCRHRAPLLGLATGAAFGVVAALTKEVSAVAPHGLPALLTSWPLYALTAAGAVGMLLSQAAYRAGPLTGSLPVITIADPVLAVALGVVGFGETLAGGPVVLVAATGGFVATTVGTVALARRSARGVEPDSPGERPAATPAVPGARQHTDIPRGSCRELLTGTG